MRLRFLGAVGAVTGSAYLLEHHRTDDLVLIDFGMSQGEPDSEERNRVPLPFDPRRLTAVVLTHAHTDHSGLIPRLYREGYTGTVTTLHATAWLAHLLLRDAADRNRRLFTSSDVAKIVWHQPDGALSGIASGLGNGLTIRFSRSGHILGAASVTITGQPDRRPVSITFSGDIGPNPEGAESLPLVSHGQTPIETDYVVMESTYGATIRKGLSVEHRLQHLATEIERGLFEQRGVVVIPCCAVGRTQDVLLDLTLLFARRPDLFRDIPVWFDAPLAGRVSHAYAGALGETFNAQRGVAKHAWIGTGLTRLLGLLPNQEDIAVDCVREMLLHDHVRTQVRPGWLKHWRRIWELFRDDSQRHRVGGPAIIITGGGMCTGGRVHGHLARLLGEATTTVLMPGYAPKATVAGTLLRFADAGTTMRPSSSWRLNLGREGTFRVRDIQASIRRMDGYSGHRDQLGLVDWLFGDGKDRLLAPTVFITHGEDAARRSLQDAILSHALHLGQPVHIERPTPSSGWYDLGRGTWSYELPHVSPLPQHRLSFRHGHELPSHEFGLNV